MKRNYMVPAALVAAALVIGVPTVAAASQNTYPWDSADIKNQSLGSVDLAPNSVGSSEIRGNAVGTSEVKYSSLNGWDIENSSLTGVDVKSSSLDGSDIKDGSLTTKDLSTATKASLQGKDGKDGRDGIIIPISRTSEFVTVDKIGGSFKTNATLAYEIALPAGKYLVSAHGFFISNQETSGNTSLQVALRSGWNGTDAFGTDYGTGFTGSAPSQAQREVTTSTPLTTIELTEETTLQVLVFGYDNAGQGSADSGKFDSQVTLTAIPVL